MLRALYVDFNSYFASVEQQLRPELRGHPVIVVPMLADTTCAIAASYEAKRRGVTTLTLVGDAKQLIPELRIIEARPAEYVRFHQRAKEIIETVAPITAVNSIDEMWLRLTGRDQQRDNAIALAEEIKYRLETRLGECMKTSIGIAPNPFLAKTASNMKKPDALTVIELADLPNILLNVPLPRFNGIGRNMLQRLREHGIDDTPKLLAADSDTLRKVWGGIEGERYWQKLRGDPVEPGSTKTSSISHSHVLPPDARTHTQAQAVLSRLTQKAAMRLRDGGYICHDISLSIRMRSGEKYSTHERLDSTDRTQQLLNSAQRLYESLLRDRAVRMSNPMHVGMALSGLASKDTQSRSLFDNQPNSEKLDRIVDQLNLKFGKNTLFWGGAYTARKAAPMRIAFNHVPDLRTESDE